VSTSLRIVRQGKTIRLKSREGTFSYFRPDQLFTGFSWDAHTAGLLLIKHQVRAILILGLGGGTIARQCRLMFPRAEIVGVEIDRGVVEWARRYFELESLGISTVITPGQDYLRRVRRQFDAIVDDMWSPQPGDPRPALVEPDWISLINARLRRSGVYTLNLYSRKEDRVEFFAATSLVKSAFPTVCEIRPRLGPTTVFAAGFNLYTPREVRTRLRRLPRTLSEGLAHVRLSSL
jgi:spermidine synthase